jgi:small-conductance mechanosensitive channel
MPHALHATLLTAVTNATRASAPGFVRDLVDAFAGWGREELLWSLGLLVAAALAGTAASALAVRALQSWSKHRKASIAALAAVRMNGPLRWLGPVIAVEWAAPLAKLPGGLEETVRQCLVLAVIAGMCWLALRAVGVAETVVVGRFDMSSADNLHARAVYTQMRGLGNVASFVVVVVAVAFALLSFDRVRQIGAGLLASAGLAGLVLGFAAQKSLAALVSGIQIAFTQPIRIDDVVVVEGESGRIEEITLTYVVVKIWDGRRLLLPVGYFLEKPFQNWTRGEASFLATVDLHLDYSTSVDLVRREAKRILGESELWDGRTWSVQVTDSTERTMLVRVLVSAKNAGAASDLKADVREQLIAYLQREHPACLPRERSEASPPTLEVEAANNGARTSETAPHAPRR